MVAKRTYTIASVIAGIFLASNLVLSAMSTTAFAATNIDGTGATFPDPLIQNWIDRYEIVRPTTIVSYTPVGSGGGINSITNELVDFGGTDAPLSASEQATFAAHGTPLTMPETIGGVVVSVNIAGIANNELRLTGKVVADIYLGKIRFWDAAAIKGLQTPAVAAKLTHKEIVTVHRLDSSGTTFVFTEYLTKISTSWASTVGTSKAPTWPANPPKFLTGDGNAGVAQKIEDTLNSIGYIELTYALQNGIDTVKLKNKANFYIIPSLSSVKAAAINYVANNPLPKGDQSWAGVSMTNAPGGSAWPISSFTYFIFYEESKDNASVPNLTVAKELKRWLNWVNTAGQSSADDLSYVPLPLKVKDNNTNTLKMMTFNGVQIAVAPTGPPS